MKIGYKVIPGNAIGFNVTNKEWEHVTLPEQHFGDFMQNYHHLEIGVSDFAGVEHTLKAYDYASELLSYEHTLQMWLDEKAGIALALSPGLPELKFSKGWWQPIPYERKTEIHLAPPNTHYTQDFSIEDATDVVVVPEKSDEYRTYLKEVLYTVDGLFVRHHSESYGVRLVGAGSIILNGESGGNVGAVVFTDIGNASTHDLNTDDVVKIDTSRSYYSNLMVKSPVPLTSATVGVVICGVMHWIPKDDVFSDTSFTLSLANTNILKYLMATTDKYDWSELGITDFETSESVPNILSEAVLEKIINHVSTFMVVVQSPWLTFEEITMDQLGAYGQYRIDDYDKVATLGYLVDHHGIGVNYWPRWDYGIWTLYTNEYSRENYQLNTVKWKKHKVIDNRLDHTQKYSRPELTMKIPVSRKI